MGGIEKTDGPMEKQRGIGDGDEEKLSEERWKCGNRRSGFKSHICHTAAGRRLEKERDRASLHIKLSHYLQMQMLQDSEKQLTNCSFPTQLFFSDFQKGFPQNLQSSRRKSEIEIVD